MNNIKINSSSLFQSSLSTPLLDFLLATKEAGFLLDIDFHYAGFIASEVNKGRLTQREIDFVGLLSCRLVNSLHAQHTCLNFEALEQSAVFSELPPELLRLQLAIDLPQKDVWPDILDRSGLVTNVVNIGEHREYDTPWIMYHGFLYLTRYFKYEANIAEFILKPVGRDGFWYHQHSLEQQLSAVEPYFQEDSLPVGETDWQKQAVINSLSRRFSVVTGGPGTGKTTTVVKLLAALSSLYLSHREQASQKLKIMLVAPTGKAAMRLAESMMQSKAKLRLSDEISELLPDSATTIHRILKPRGHNNFYHNSQKPLNLDVLVVDEASMVDLALMSKLLDAVPAHGQIIVLGDKQQLSSVDAGNVLADICQLNQGRFPEFVTELKKSWRFDGSGAIGMLAKAIIDMNRTAVQGLLQRDNAEVVWLNSVTVQEQVMLEQGVEHQLSLFDLLAKLTSENEQQVVKTAFEHLAKYQILTCVNKGNRGVEGVNKSIKQRLAAKRKVLVSELHFHGRPIMIAENAPHLGLFNGDIGLQMYEPNNNSLMTYFIEPSGQLLKIMPQRLPKHDTVYGMTVHKSQGSEFSHVALLMPESDKSFQKVSKEVLYTAVTRSKLKFTLFGSEQQVLTAVTNRTVRRSGLANMLA